MIRHEADPRSKLSTPPSDDVTWEVATPSLVDGIDSWPADSRPVPLPWRMYVRVKARTWFAARAAAVVKFAKAGIYVSPQSVRDARVVP